MVFDLLADALATGAAKLKRTSFYAAYRRFFSIEEIENDIALQWFQGAILVGFLTTYMGWFYDAGTTLSALWHGDYACWPFFQSCNSWFWLLTLPTGYSQPILFMILFAFMILIPFLMYKKEWVFSHFLFLLLLASKFYFMAINYDYKGNYDYYHFLFTFILVFLPHKRFFAQLMVVMFYFLSTSSKISPSWILGAYFTPMQGGLPLFPRGTEMVWTNLVMIEEMFGAWLLFSSNRFLQRLELMFYITFHLYSGLLVGYFYPSIVLPMVIILFGPWFKPYKEVPLDIRAIPGWVMIASLVLLQALPVMIHGNERLTNEGNFYGLYMFEANHQCVLTISSGDTILRRYNSNNARMRCDAYENWFKNRNRFCQGIGPISMVLDHSINGGPFYRIVNEPDICKLAYKPFSHNSWIHDDSDAPVVGYPQTNYYR